MYISTTLRQNKLFRLPTQNKTNHSPVFQTKSITVTQYTSFNVKPTKMLSDPVAETFGLIHRHPSGENLLLGDIQLLLLVELEAKNSTNQWSEGNISQSAEKSILNLP